MALVALDRLGAPDERLAAYAERYSQKLEPPGEAEARLKRDAAAKVATHDVDTMLRAGLEGLSGSLAGAAFHEIIHLAYAVEAYDAAEIASALAHWQSEAQALDVVFDGRGRGSVGAALATLKDAELTTDAAGLIVDQIAAVAAQEGFAGAIGALAVDDNTVAALAAAALRAFAATQDFVGLHMLTGCHALRIVAETVPDQATALVHGFWPVFAGAYVVIGAPALDAAADDDAADWPTLHTAARAHDDEHVIKIIYSCWQESLAYGDDGLYRTAAGRYLNDRT